MSDPAHRWLRPAALALTSIALLGIIVPQVDLALAGELVLRPRAIGWLAAALLLFNLSKIVSAHRLNLLQRQAGIRLSEKANLRLYYAGMLLNLCLPGGIGGDGFKIVTLARQHGAPYKTLFVTTAADRAGGLLALLMLLCMMLPWLALPLAPAAILAAAGLAGTAAGTLLLHRCLPAMRGAGIVHLLALGAAVQLLQLACMATLLSYQHIPMHAWMPYLTLFLVSSAVAVLPLSWGGLGLRELSFLIGARLLDADPLPGILAASGFFLLGALSSLPGALFLWPREPVTGGAP